MLHSIFDCFSLNSHLNRSPRLTSLSRVHSRLSSLTVPHLLRPTPISLAHLSSRPTLPSLPPHRSVPLPFSILTTARPPDRESAPPRQRGTTAPPRARPTPGVAHSLDSGSLICAASLTARHSYSSRSASLPPSTSSSCSCPHNGNDPLLRLMSFVGPSARSPSPLSPLDSSSSSSSSSSFLPSLPSFSACAPLSLLLLRSLYLPHHHRLSPSLLFCLPVFSPGVPTLLLPSSSSSSLPPPLTSTPACLPAFLPSFLPVHRPGLPCPAPPSVGLAGTPARLAASASERTDRPRLPDPTSDLGSLGGDGRKGCRAGQCSDCSPRPENKTKAPAPTSAET
ncbi:hypothetical protein MPTK1_7g14580 [Marchantia polymorpha subsp. ruderalis]|uniref:Uncharacterized protein n=2 Tax=Marchantia polymorpha TaxID=3197 RepID=A0AAF6BZL2_MARPO|nr:hypothetical protein MARPO_0009s0143 [Marchantia polymorpha]BBN17446.1 hypothetical protein Mp_7g14580 [Marchantia polymorpha subsp. ruderalis]|eukprot:PTQ47052.1 hypothetical protein MARPO_0009s0143 [Marchantia polymorpha]